MQSGLIYLQEEMRHCNPLQELSKKPAIPIYSFINQLIVSLRQFSHVHSQISWADYLLTQKKQMTCLKISLNANCQVPYYSKWINKKQKFTQDCGTNISMLDEIVLKHEDVITIVHRMFPASLRREIINGIKKVFISFRVSNAKIYAAVFIEYILSIYDSAQEQQQSIMAGENTSLTSHIAFSQFSSIINFNSNLHRQNGLFQKNQCIKKTSDHEYAIIQTKFLPQQIETRKSRLSCEDQSYSYHNSINYKQQKSKTLINNPKYSRQKQNIIQNQKASILNSNFGSGKEIKIEDQESIEQKSEQQYYNLGESQNQFDQLVCRNQLFKNRILSNSHLKSNLSLKEQESINDTINIIHNSIVRHHRNHVC